jgi:hypothetical protein
MNLLDMFPITDRKDIPANFTRITVLIPIEEIGVITSIWDGIKTTDAMVTFDGHRVQFWRARIVRVINPPSLTVQRHRRKKPKRRRSW